MSGAIEEFPKLYLVGLKTILRRAGESHTNRSGIAPLWLKMMAELSAFKNRVGTDRYALITGDLTDQSSEPALYYAMFEVTDFEGIDPQKWTLVDRGPGRWYRFTHRGPPETVGHTVSRELQELSAQARPPLKNEELFIYPEGYDRTDPQCKFDVALFLAD